MTSERREELLENLSGVQRLLEWDKDISSQVFAEEFVYLPKSNAVGAGQRVDFKYSPHIIKPLEAFDNIHVLEIWLMFASQMAKTLFLFICWAKNAKLNPKTMVWMISKEVMIPRYQKEKITDLVEASEELKKIISEGLEEQKKSKSKVGIFYHQGTATYLIGSKTSDDKKSVTAKTAIVDEADEMDGLQAITPLQERTKTFSEVGGKMIVASTKKHKNGAITQGFNSCEQKNYLGMECPHCEELIEINHKNFIIELPEEYREKHKLSIEEFTKEIISEQYIPKASREAYYECNECQKKITSEQKKRQIITGKFDWIVKGVQNNPRTIGFSANSMMSYFVPFENMAKQYLRALIQEDENERIEQLQTFYEGYFNDYYDPKRKEISKSDDILTLGSGLRKREPPEDTKVIYMTIDTQKGHKDKGQDHYWYFIGAVDSKMNVYKLESGKIYKDKDIYGKIFSTYNIGERKIGIRRVIWDIQGHGEIETLAFIHKINSVIGTFKYSDDENRCNVVYPYRGMAEIQNKTYRLIMEEKQSDGLAMKKYPLIVGNSKRGKDTLNNAITKTVKFRKGDEVQNSDQGMYFIDEDEVEDGAKRLKDKNDRGLKIPNEAFEKQMTSEAYGVSPHGKSTKEGWHVLYKGRDNHMWDCSYMFYIAIEFDGLQERIFGR